MANINRTPDSNKFFADHAASLDALVAAAKPPPPFVAYPGDHPCEIKGCASNAPFGMAALPRRVWFCRQHWEEMSCLWT
jgi:hypothetical protein